MSEMINIQAAKTHLSRIVDQVAAGEEVIIAKAGKPMAKLVPYQPAKKPRTPGLFAGQGWESPDCWEPDTELIDSFYNSKLDLEGPLTNIPSQVAEDPPK